MIIAFVVIVSELSTEEDTETCKLTDEQLQPDHQLSDEQADEYSLSSDLHPVDADDSCVDLLLDNERLHFLPSNPWTYTVNST